jgi:hypothetical protein
MQGVSKRALQWYFKCYSVVSYEKGFFLKAYKLSIVQGIFIADTGEAVSHISSL